MVKSFPYIIVFALAILHGNAQDSLTRKATHKIDSVTTYNNKSLDSLQRGFHHQTDSLQRAYAAPMNKLHSELNRLNHKKDSLNKLKLPTQSVTHKIDSVEREQTKKLNELNADIAKVKKETLAKVSALHLPPQAQKEVDAFTKNIHGFSVPNNFFRLPGMNLKIPGIGGMPSLGIPSNLSIPTTSIPSLQKMNLNLTSGGIPSLSQLEGSLGKDIKQLQSMGNLANEKALEQDVMKVASQNAEVKSIVQEQSKVTGMASELSKAKDAKGMEAVAQQQLAPAVNHFAGKEQELNSAMSQVSKLKQKYSNVKSMTELPKRAPNPLHDKPWIERIVPGVNYFIQSKQYTLVDVNPYIGWRFNPRLTASVGWNQRIGVAHGGLNTRMYDRVYGVRSSVSYLWTHGILFTASPEVMKAYVPTNGLLDQKQQATVWGVYAGIRKNFPFYKSLSGYSEVLYHFSQKPGQNIYGDRVVFRFGIEMKLKKKLKKK